MDIIEEQWTKLKPEDVSSLKEDELLSYYRYFTDKILVLYRRYKNFTRARYLRNINYTLLFLTYLFVLGLIFRSFGYREESILGILSTIILAFLVFGGLIFVQYHFEDYFKFRNELVNKEIDRMNNELNSFTFYLIEIINEIFIRNKAWNIKKLKKERHQYEKIHSKTLRNWY